GRTDKSLRTAVAVQAPLHVKRRRLPGQRHLIDAAMAGGAADAFLHVNTVIEVDEVRKVVDAVPTQRFARAQAFANRLEHATLHPNLVMTVHANARRWDSRERGCLHR